MESGEISEIWQGRDLKIFGVWKYGRLGEFGRAGKHGANLFDFIW